MRVGRRISVVALNTNLNADLDFTGGIYGVAANFFTTTAAGGLHSNNWLGHGGAPPYDDVAVFSRLNFAGAVDARISNLDDPTAAQDALTLHAWANYAPTWTWTVTPAAPTIIARWVKIGNIVHYLLSYHSTNSNGGVLSNVTLPAAATASAAITAVTVLFQNTNAYVPTVGFGYQAPGGSDLSIKLCPVTVDAQVIDVYIAGFTEVTA